MRSTANSFGTCRHKYDPPPPFRPYHAPEFNETTNVRSNVSILCNTNLPQTPPLYRLPATRKSTSTMTAVRERKRGTEALHCLHLPCLRPHQQSALLMATAVLRKFKGARTCSTLLRNLDCKSVYYCVQQIVARVAQIGSKHTYLKRWWQRWPSVSPLR